MNAVQAIRKAEKIAPVEIGQFIAAPDHGNCAWRLVRIVWRRPSRFPGRDTVTFENAGGVRTCALVVRHTA